MTIYTATMTLILVMDPLGNIPMFLSSLNTVHPTRRRRIILQETFIAFVVLMAFLLFGKHILSSMNISDPALSISGGIILFLIALRMIFPPHEEDNKLRRQNSEPFIVPLAVPYIAGPSTMTMVMLLATQQPEHLGLWMLALTLAWITTTIILIFSERLRKILGEKGITAIERLMGMILTTMAVQMFLTGVSKFFNL